MTKTAVALRHVAFEDLGCFEPVLTAAGFKVVYCEAGVDDPSGVAGADLLIVVGGPIGAYDEQLYPFLTHEIRLLERRLKAGSPTIGICLGAQLMARALGARVAPGPAKEIGFAPLDLTEAGRASCLAAFEGEPVLHWHGDAFDLPEGAVRLASTSACPNQAFAYGRAAIGFQFHPEAVSVSLEPWLIGHAVELARAGIDVPALRARHEVLLDGLRQRGAACLDMWIKELYRG